MASILLKFATLGFDVLSVYLEFCSIIDILQATTLPTNSYLLSMIVLHIVLKLTYMKFDKIIVIFHSFLNKK